jgi:hypothetical protein
MEGQEWKQFKSYYKEMKNRSLNGRVKAFIVDKYLNEVLEKSVGGSLCDLLPTNPLKGIYLTF